MIQHPTATREEWLTARLKLLEAEKAHTRAGDEVARQRQALPWVKVDATYRFDTDRGARALKDLFGGRSQLIVYHLMFGPDYEAACPSCSAIADGFNGIYPHLQNHDVAFWAVSGAALAKLDAFKRRMGWNFPWASSQGGAFNHDFNVGVTVEQQAQGGYEYNYRPGQPLPPGPGSGPGAQAAAQAGTDFATFARERPGMSAFALQDGAVHHTYSTYARGLDGLWAMYAWLDRAPLGRNEDGMWWRHHDRYAAA